MVQFTHSMQLHIMQFLNWEVNWAQHIIISVGNYDDKFPIWSSFA